MFLFTKKGMAILRRWKITYLIIVELAHKYTRALISGFISGLILSITFLRIYPAISVLWLMPVNHIGIVGDYTPNSLPLFIQRKISMGLTNLTEDGSSIPGLATSWVASDSGKIFTFYLRKDLLWHNKKPVHASSVNYNIRGVTFTPIDQFTLRATLHNSYSPFPVLVSKPLFQSGLIGFGPYRVTNIQLNGDLVNYLRLTPVSQQHTQMNVLEYRFYHTESQAILAYKLGEIDMIDDLTSPYDLPSFINTAITNSVSFSRILTLFYNFDNTKLADKAFRQGLAYAIPNISGERAYT